MGRSIDFICTSIIYLRVKNNTDIKILVYNPFSIV